MTLAKFSKLSNFNPKITSLDLSFFMKKALQVFWVQLSKSNKL